MRLEPQTDGTDGKPPRKTGVGGGDDDNFRALRLAYIERAVERLTTISDLMEKFDSQSGQYSFMRELLRQFHWFAGSTPIYGFPETSKIALRGEEYCESVLRTQKYNARELRDHYDRLNRSFKLELILE